jgi:hypothetical protein
MGHPTGRPAIQGLGRGLRSMQSISTCQNLLRKPTLTALL